ncbi:MAG: hypothetical protein HPY76_05945 [Anaerolineae bacterium]|nr:hypothetical protein [Anaerolineae bacterium]
MKPKIASILILILMLFVNVSGATAQTYRFQVPSDEVHLYLNANGTATIEYTIVFYNDASADPIDFVDIGLPNENYSFSNISANVDSIPITNIEKSPYVSPGIALGLGSASIQPNRQGTVHVRIAEISGFFFKATEEEAEPYASFQFSPNWFGSEYVYGNTDLTMVFHFPPELLQEEPRYFTPKRWTGTPEPEAGIDPNNLIFYRWRSPDANSYTQYTFGGSFPARLIPAAAIVEEPKFSLNLDAIFENLCCVGFGLLFGGIFVFAIYSSTVGAKKRKLKYLPPRISIEGHGIKRGLTAVEAAILMEQPMDRVITMILFSVIKKGAATVVTREPLKLNVNDPLPEGLHAYEISFLEAFKQSNAKERTKELQDMVIALIRSVSQKMKGFSHKETVDYYKDIMERAWAQVEAADTPDVKVERFDEYMGWTMLDGDFDNRARRTFGSGPIFVPMWWGNYDPSIRPMTSGGGGAVAKPSSSGQSVSLPNLPGGSFAASMVGGIQSFSSGVVGDLTSFTSRITGTTNPPPKPSSYSGGRSSGGGGCACACACAGCACACAGGGR